MSLTSFDPKKCVAFVPTVGDLEFAYIFLIVFAWDNPLLKYDVVYLIFVQFLCQNLMNVFFLIIKRDSKRGSYKW